MPLGWAIVSTGRHPDQKMAPAVNAAEDAELVAVVSRDLGRAQEFAAKHGAPAAYDDYDAMLRDPAVQVVYLASPNFLHADQAVKAAQAGKHVLCEKPMALTVEDCQRMIESCRQHDVRLGLGFHLRHHPGHRQLREVVKSGALGTVAMVRGQWGMGVRGQVLPPPRPPLQQWWEDPAMVGAGVFVGNGVHSVDLLRYLLGEEVVEVTALTDGQREEQPLEQLATLLLRFQSGILGMVVSSRRLPDSHNDVVLYGSDGRGSVYGSIGGDLQGRLEVTSETVNMEQQYEPPDRLRMFVGEVEAFNQAVASGAEPSASGWDGLKVAEVTIAMVESARTGRSIAIP